MTTPSPSPPESLVQYGDPIFTGETVDPSKKAPTAVAPPAVTDKDAIQRIEDILNAILPPQ
ncbi:hypothetical protein PINS_up022280 [Pythium insidiosum]|nr:hypothetical protein PINS_up015556 [Pythium insidiosum]GLE10242.1 hypothetical protein PINS_up022280 [Pythium insidiosum]